MATAIRGRIVRLSTKAALKDITIEAIDIATGLPAATTTTSNDYGFYSLTGLTDAVYFANPLIADDDWTLQPDTNVLFGGAIYIPDDTTTPRVQITNADFGGIVGLDTGDTYDDSDGTGTYQFLLSQNDGKAYFGAGAVILDSSGITLTGTDALEVLQESITSPVTTTTGLRISQIVSGVGGGGLQGIRVDQVTNTSSGTTAALTPLSVAAVITLGDTVTDATGIRVSTSGAVSGESFAVRVVGVATGGTVNAAYGTAFPGSGPNNYALYISSPAQSVHAGNFRIGSTTAPTVALHVTGEGLFDESVNSTTQVLISNQSSGTSAGAAFNALVPSTSTGGDVYFSATIAATKAFSWGIDNSDSDAWVLSENATLGTSNRIRALGDDVQLLTTLKTTENGVYIKGGTAAYGSDTAGVLLDGALDSAGTDLAVNFLHTATSGAGHAVLQLGTHPSGTGDPQVHFRISGTQSWRFGVDNSASDALVISRGSALGTNDVLSISTGDTITLADGVDIAVNTSTGTQIGTGSTQKLGFYGATPVARPSAYTQTYSTADKTHANDGSADFPAGGVGTAAGGWSTAANRDLAITRFNALRTTVTDLKQLVNSVIDDLQALGLVG